jgi:hypothetical protein
MEQRCLPVVLHDIVGQQRPFAEFEGEERLNLVLSISTSKSERISTAVFGKDGRGSAIIRSGKREENERKKGANP